ncbi:hypothetical protein [Bradyrhizobium tunisiense]|uniref:hypothetical protein n=1 Tax=Bradyrhizobium tunisiense TaxID=3278709 RepID=UPI0035DA1B08
MGREFYRKLAQQARHLAERADPFTRQRLLKLAGSYDVKGGNLARAPRPTERPLPIPRTAPPASIFSGPGEAG